MICCYTHVCSPHTKNQEPAQCLYGTLLLFEMSHLTPLKVQIPFGTAHSDQVALCAVLSGVSDSLQPHQL